MRLFLVFILLISLNNLFSDSPMYYQVYNYKHNCKGNELEFKIYLDHGYGNYLEEATINYLSVAKQEDNSDSRFMWQVKIDENKMITNSFIYGGHKPYFRVILKPKPLVKGEKYILYMTSDSGATIHDQYKFVYDCGK